MGRHRALELRSASWAGRAAVLLSSAALASLTACPTPHARIRDGGYPPVAGLILPTTPLPWTWREGSLHHGLRVAFTGYGEAGPTGESERTVRIAPMVSTVAGETHATLITSTTVFSDVDVRLRMRTTAHLRVGEPNPWEVGWTLWHYTGNTSFYYFILKPNGWELGKADPAYPGAQRFLATGSAVYDPFAWHEIHVVQSGATMSVEVDGLPIVTFTDEERPYTSGAVGLYSEDAEVEFADLHAIAAR